MPRRKVKSRTNTGLLTGHTSYDISSSALEILVALVPLDMSIKYESGSVRLKLNSVWYDREEMSGHSKKNPELIPDD